jgi:eukaryotic-like serine/threonine-protein kinase
VALSAHGGHSGAPYGWRMKGIWSPVITLSVYLALELCARADVVTQPLRKFGLGDLQQVALSPNRQWMATSGASGAFVWDYTNGTVLHRLEAHHRRVLSICFSPDSQVLLTGGGDALVRAWQVDTGAELRDFSGHIGEIMHLAFAPNGESFVSVGDHTARVWSLSTGELLHTMTVTGASFTHALFTPDGNRLVTADASSTNSVRLWDLATQQTIRSFGSLVDRLGLVAGGQLVTASSDLAVKIWDIETGQIVRPLAGATQPIIGLLASTNDSTVIAGCLNGQVITWDASTGDVPFNFVGEKLVHIAAVTGTNQVLTAHADKLVRVKERQIGSNLRHFPGHTTSTTLGVGFSPNRQDIVSGGVEVFTRVWNRTNAQQVGALPGHGAGTETARFSPDGTRILTTFGAPILSARLSNPQTAAVEREFFGHTGWLLAAVFSQDGLRIATGAQDGTARLWDVATGTQIRAFISPGTWIRSVALSSNGMLLASGASDGVARLWNTANGELLRSFELNAGSVTSLDFSPATGELLVAWEDGVLRTFDPATGELKLNSLAPAGFLEAALFSPDGRFILDGEGWPSFSARLWDARTGEELRVFAGHAAPVDSIAFDPTGTCIVTGADIVRLWSMADIAARLESGRKPNGLELRWSVGTLQQSASVNGPWLDLTNAVSPRLAPIDQPSAFFRTKADLE